MISYFSEIRESLKVRSKCRSILKINSVQSKSNFAQVWDNYFYLLLALKDFEICCYCDFAAKNWRQNISCSSVLSLVQF